MSELVIKWDTIAEKWGKISGMLAGGSVNLTPNTYVLTFLFKIIGLCFLLHCSFFRLFLFESTDLVFYFLLSSTI